MAGVWVSTTPTNVSVGNDYSVDTSTSAIVLNLPAVSSLTSGAFLTVTDGASMAGVNDGLTSHYITISAFSASTASDLIDFNFVVTSGGGQMVLDLNNAAVRVVVASTSSWRVTSL